MKYPKYKKELLNKFYDTLASNINYPTINFDDIEDCGVSYGEDWTGENDKEWYMFFNMKNGESIKFIVSTEKGKYI